MTDAISRMINVNETTKTIGTSKLPTIKLSNEQVEEFSELARKNLCEDCFQRMMLNLTKNGG